RTSQCKSRRTQTRAGCHSREDTSRPRQVGASRALCHAAGRDVEGPPGSLAAQAVDRGYGMRNRESGAVRRVYAEPAFNDRPNANPRFGGGEINAHGGVSHYYGFVTRGLVGGRRPVAVPENEEAGYRQDRQEQRRA